MHELPKDLTNSLRSFRGSIYGRRAKPDPEAQEMEHHASHEEGYGDKQFEEALSETDSSHMENPMASTHPAHRPNYNHNAPYYYDLEKQDAELPPFTRSPTHQDNTPYNDPSSPKAQQSHETKSSILGRAVDDLDPAADRLARDLTPLSTADFSSLMGMREPTEPLQSLASLAVPHGLYDKIHRQWRHNDRQFKVFDAATYGLIVLQLIISAVFIILGALKNVDTHITIAVLGAVATVLAGALALMKGQGLPNRLRQTRDALRDVLFEADELYWDVRSGRPVLYKDIKKIREDYLRVLQQARAHHPDAWSSGDDGVAQGLAKATKKK